MRIGGIPKNYRYKMPELPEVETIKRQLRNEIIGLTIKTITSDTPKMVKPSLSFVKQNIRNLEIQRIDRIGKYIIFQLTNNHYVIIHLKLNGRILIRSKKFPKDDYTHVILSLSQGMELRLADSRKFAFIELCLNHERIDQLTKQIGPEPYHLDDKKFYQLIRKSNQKIKQLLLDQKQIGGIGNIYANDALWLAKTHPATKSNLLTLFQAKRLRKALISVMDESLEKGGASDMWYRHIHGEKGSYQDHFKVYGQKGKPCLIHKKTLIEYIKIGQRGTFYCPKCQTKS